MPIVHSTHFDALSLGTLPENTQAQVADLLEQIAEKFQDDSDRLNPTTRKASITVKIELEHSLEHRQTQMICKVEGKLPGYRGAGTVVKLPHGGERFLIELDDATQLDMYRPTEEDPEQVQ